MLDLEMPIMNGFEACEKIRACFDNDKKLFKLKKKVQKKESALLRALKEV
jgi:CheY-like chemotaxis protein